MQSDQLTLQKILQLGYAAYERRHALPEHVRRAVWAIQPWDWQRACAERGEAHPERCPVCGQRLVCTALIPRVGVPPPAARDWEQVA